MIDATERWTEARLVALAAALHLPTPVHESFLFDADHAFRVSCTESDTTLQRAIKRVFQHAGVPCDAAVVLWKSGVGAAKVDRDGHSWFFELEPMWRTNAEVLGVILAREAARALLAQQQVSPSHTSADDADLELTATLAGLGSLIANGVAANAAQLSLRPRLLRYAFVRVAKSLGIAMSRALSVLPAKLHVVLAWPRISRHPLPAKALDAHVVIRCFCGRRLRVPTGAIGETTCPACKRKRPFDGRGCTTDVIASPRTLPPGIVPVLTPLQRLGIAVLELPLAARVTAILAISLVVIALL